MYLGDFSVGATVKFKWNTTVAGTGSVTRSTNGTVRIYKDASVTQRTSASGITDTEDFDALTGLHHLTIDLSDNTDAGFYASGSDYQVVVEGMVAGGETFNVTIANFSIENRAVISKIATAQADLDTLTGANGAIIASGTQTFNITGNITGNLTGSVGSVTGAINTAAGVITTLDGLDTAQDSQHSTTQSRLPAALVSGRMDSSVGAMAANTVTASALATDAAEEIADTVWDETQAAHVTVGSFGEIATEIASILADTGTDGVVISAASIRAAVGLASANLDTQLDALPTANENADALLDRTAGVETGVTPRQGMRVMLAALAGKASGLSGSTAVYRDTNDTKDRISATVDEHGNRSAVALDST